ncbi:MAG TPA: tetratricopeptide repeat protein [Chloroflexia bacterium]|nr:tetratricopeptide repeat protein [Chloroflexia bacterium]
MSGRLKLLTAGARDLPARQRTLRGAVECSYNLLEEAEQRYFRRLGVFVGGYTVEAAKAVAGADDSPAADTLTNLEMLLDKNLITRHQGGLRRLGMLETLREYALEQLAARGEEEETRDRHAHYYLNFVKEGGEHYAGTEVVSWVHQVAAEYTNIREAMAWFFGVQGRQEGNEWAMLQRGSPHIGGSEREKAGSDEELVRIKLGTDLCTSLFPFWDAQHYLGEARAWYTLAAERIAPFAQAPDNPDPPDSEWGSSEITRAHKISPELAAIWARMLAGAGAMAYYQGEYDATRRLNEKALAIRREIGDRNGIAASLNNLGIAAMDQGDYLAAHDYLSESLGIARELAIPWKICAALGNLGITETRLGNLDAARLHLKESLVIAREAEDIQRTADALTNLSVVARFQGDVGEARRYLDEAHLIYRQLGHKSGIIQVLIQLGFVARDENHFDQARSHLSDALILLLELPNKALIADCLEGLAWLVGKRGSLERSVRLFGAAERLREVTGVPLSQAERDYYTQFLDTARQQVDAVRWDTAWAEGRAMNTEQAVAYALQGLD